MEETIKKLPDVVQALLQSSCYINSFKKSVEELVYNSLDSHATSIAVRIDHSNFSIQVIDNGTGIGETDIKTVGTKYATSKISDVVGIEGILNKYGYRGVALASLIDVSKCVKITSRHAGTDETWTKEYWKGKMERIYETVPRPSQGTTVDIKGLLYNLEIQRKNLNPTREVQDIKSFIEHTAILHTGVSFTLRDDVKNEVIVKIPKNKSLYQTIESIYGISIKENIQELQVEKNPYKVKAYVGTKCIEDDFQLIYLNGRCIVNSKLHTIVNMNLASVFNNGKDVADDSNKIKKQEQYIKEIDMNGNQYPIYILFITCPYNAYDISQMNNKTLVEFHNWTLITGLLKTMVKVFIEGFKTRNASDQKEKILANDEEKLKTHVERNKESKNNNNIQEQVAIILERIKKSDSKKLHVQNGVKGKPAKRRNKKTKTLEFSLKSNKNKYCNINKLILESVKKTKKKSEDLESINVTQYSMPKAIKQKENTKKEASVQIKEPKNIRSNAAKIKLTKRHRNKIDTKTAGLSKKEITKVFETLNESVKQRCKELSSKVAYLIKNHKVKNFKTKYVSVQKLIKTKDFSNKIESVQKYTNTKNVYNQKVESKHKTSAKIVIEEFIPFPRNCDRIKFLEKYVQTYFKKPEDKLEVKSRYDLLQTIIKSQNITTEKVKKIIDNKNKTSTEKLRRKHENINFPTLTYQSHNYENKKRHYSGVGIRSASDQSIEKNVPTKRQKKIRNKDTCKVENYNADVTTINRKHISQKTNRITNNTGHFIDTSSYDVIQNSKFTDNMEINTEYNFDDEVNKYIPLSLTYQEIPYMDDNSSNEVGIQRDCSKNNSRKNIQKAHRQNKQFYKTYIIEQPVQEIYSKPNDAAIKNGNSVSCSEQLTNKVSKSTKTNASQNHNITHFETIHTFEEKMYSEPFTNNIFTCTNNKKFWFKKFYNTTDDDNIKVTFASKICPEEINETNPINFCQAIIESTDIFDTTSLHITENSGVTKKANVGYEKSNMEKDLAPNDCEITDENLPNGQENLNSFIDESLAQALLNFTNQGSHKNPTNGSNLVPSSILCVTNSDKTDKIQIDHEIEIAEKVTNPNLVERVNDNGEVCYLNVNTGMTFNTNGIIDSNNFNLKRRPNYIPKGLSPIFQNKIYDKNAVELPSQDYFTMSMYENFVNEVEKGAEVYEAAAQNLAEITTKDTNKAQTKFKKMNASIVFEGTALGSAKVLKQVDNKFIACLMEGKKYQADRTTNYLVLFDQHAAHERIYLEQLVERYKKNSTWKTVACDKFNVSLSEEEMFYLENFSSKFKEIGLYWNVDPSCGKNEVAIVSIPAAVLGKHNRKMEVVSNAVKTIIREHVKTLKCMNGAANTPKTLTDLVNMEACRSAVKFGDRLNKDACIDMIRALSVCLAPFQCAHGRPDVAVLLMVKPDQRTYKGCQPVECTTDLSSNVRFGALKEQCEGAPSQLTWYPVNNFSQREQASTFFRSHTEISMQAFQLLITHENLQYVERTRCENIFSYLFNVRALKSTANKNVLSQRGARLLTVFGTIDEHSTTGAKR